MRYKSYTESAARHIHIKFSRYVYVPLNQGSGQVGLYELHSQKDSIQMVSSAFHQIVISGENIDTYFNISQEERMEKISFTKSRLWTAMICLSVHILASESVINKVIKDVLHRYRSCSIYV